MTITKHLVELHGGTIKVESSGEGQGSTFTVKMPVVIVHARETVSEKDVNALVEKSDASAFMLQGLRVVVVEDDSDARRLLVTVLEHSGANVTACATVSDGLEAVRETKPDLLISDIEIVGGDGYSLIKDIRSLDEPIANIPAIALTAHTRHQDRVRALSAGFQLHIAKPVEPLELILAIANLANRRKKQARS
jgi:CheY-like chemotaxis protein